MSRLYPVFHFLNSSLGRPQVETASRCSGYKGQLPCPNTVIHPYPLVILLLLDLFHLIKQLASSELQLRQFVLGSNLRVVVGMLSNLDV